ncbi:MAG: calcium-translocating P-type ATPase, PMCA-type [Cetobacterium sp.]|uniref:calcium-translocating P-type ATPase, PMCA-type n=2 Tax=Cetobacterium sp. TaxID=2071632 RepID=UPI002FCC6F19
MDSTFSKEINELLKNLDSSSQGLSLSILESKENKFGKNIITKIPEKTFLRRVLVALSEPMVKILVFAIFLTIIINFLKISKGEKSDWPETIGITLSVILATSITVLMEMKSQKSFNLLKEIGEKIFVKTIREGKILEVAKENIYPGDIIILSIGDKVPADGIVIESFNLEVDEGILTGESFSVKKHVFPLEPNINFRIFSGTYIVDGTGKFVITKTGDNTEFGKISKSVQKNYEILTPLQQELGILGKKIALIGISIAIIVFLLKIFNFSVHQKISLENIIEALTLSIVLIVSTIPEGLSTMVATTLALSMIKLSKENALIKKLTSCEAIGSIDLICSDKTGTITQNKMIVTESLIINDHFIFLNIKFNNNSFLKEENGVQKYFGNPTEIALLNYASSRETPKNISILHKYPFSSEKKKMGTIIQVDNVYIYLIKGASEIILENLHDLNNEEKKVIEEKIQICQKQAKRIIAFAHSIIKEDFISYEETHFQKSLIFDGFMAISDPIRPEVFPAVKVCKEAGIDIKILTGDNLFTATSIAKELNLIKPNSQILEATEIDKMTDNELQLNLENISVIARSTPMTKFRIIDLLMKSGKSVAVTGDGVNDAPALKRAEVGISMGITGTEVAKETADIILLNDSFATIVKAIKEGRGLYENFQKFIQFQQTVNLGALFLILIFEIFDWATPLRPIQILWINIMMDGPLAISLGFEKTRDNIMQENPRNKKNGILTVNMWINTLSNALFIVCFSTFMIRFLKIPHNYIPTYIFNFFTFMVIINVFNCKGIDKTSILNRIFDNKNLNIVFCAMFLIQIIINITLPEFFSVYKLSFFEYLKIIFFSSSIIFFNELVRFIRRNIK